MQNGVIFHCRADISNDIIKLFQREYEQYVLEIMNKSVTVFPGEYEFIQFQSHGECDFIDKKTGVKYDAKLPFSKEQIRLLTSGKKHKPMLEEWILTLESEAAEYNIDEYRKGTLDITRTKLYPIIKEKLERKNSDENIVLFFPFPIVPSWRDAVYLTFATDYLLVLFNKLCEDFDMSERSLFAIYPSMETNYLAIRNLKYHVQEFIYYDKLEKYYFFNMRI